MGTTNSATSNPAGKVSLDRRDRNLVLKFEGNWNVRESRHRESDALFSELDREGPADALEIDMSEVGTWDTSLLIVVARAEEWCRAHKVNFLRESLPPSVAGVIAISVEGPVREKGRGVKKTSPLFGVLC